MGNCCNSDAHKQQKRTTLITTFIINCVMFLLQFTAGIIANSTALKADALDMFGDACTYAISLYALNRGDIWLKRAAYFKGGIIAFFGIVLFIEAIIKIFHPTIAHAGIMSIFAILGLIANSACLFLLTRHRDSDINMRSTWICARNDIIGNISVLIAAALVAVLHASWPDSVIGGLMALWLLYSAYQVIQETRAA